MSGAAAKPALWVIGAGGHAKVVIATARAAGYRELVCADDNPARLGSELLGVRVAASAAEVLARADVVCVLAIGDNAARARWAATVRGECAVVVHPSTVVDDSVVLGAGSVVFAGCVIQPDTRLGAHVIVNTGASIDHDGVVGDCVHFAPGVRVAGNVAVGDGAFLGIGSCVIPGVAIGAWARVGAGAAVVRDVGERVTVVGVPARELVTV